MIWGICASCGRVCGCEAGAYCHRCQAERRCGGWADLAFLLGGLIVGGACAWLLMGGPAS